MAFTPKRNQVFKSKIAGKNIRVKAVSRNNYDPLHHMVEVVDLNNQMKPVKGTARTIYAASIIRRYAI